MIQRDPSRPEEGTEKTRGQGLREEVWTSRSGAGKLEPRNA